MAKTNELAGIIEHVGDIVSVGESGRTAKQDIIIMVPGYVDRFGDKKGKDEHWQVSLFNDQIEKFNLYPTYVGEKVKFELYVRSVRYEKDGRQMYIVNNSFASLNFVGKSTQGGARNPSSRPSNDYHEVIEPESNLPF